MFTSPVTPVRYGTWPRYNPAAIPSSPSPTAPISSLTQQLPISSRENNNNNNLDDPSLSSPTLSSPVVTTPFTFRHATYAVNPLASPVTPTTALLSSSPVFGTMGAAYPDTPSPPSTYGINGGVIVSDNGTMLGSAPGTTTATSCIRLIPSQSHVLHNTSDPFIIPPSTTAIHTKHPRPALRPTLSHNAVYQQPSSNASYRRMMAPLSATPATTTTSTASTVASTTVEAAQPISTVQTRPSTAGAVGTTPTGFPGGLSSSAPPPSAPISIPVSQPSQVGHEAHHPPPTSSEVGSPSALATSNTPHHPHQHPPHPHYHPHAPSSFPPSHSVSSTPYADEGSFHTTSYPYDTSAPSPYTTSPWSQTQGLPSPQFAHQAPLPPPFYPAPHPYFDMYGQSKQLEPILAPGEIPAPRPPMSYAALIGEALLMAPPPHHLYVSEISDSIKKRYAYYRQNPSKIYNGVRHQTSMCKAFVKLPRPFGDQSGGARKWAIRAGCESWFQGGGYHPPGSNAATAAARRTGGKAKSTARSKQLAIGTVSPPEKKVGIYDEAPWSPGPSAGPAYDGSGRPFYPYSQPQPYAAPYFSPGFHYMPIPHGQAAPTGYAIPGSQGPNFFGQWNPYPVGPPPALSTSTSTVASSIVPSMYNRSFEADSMSSPERHDWREDTHHHSGPSEHGSPDSFDGKVISPMSHGAMLSPHKASPEFV